MPIPDYADLHERLSRGRGVLALPGGGCARYVFSEEVDFRRDQQDHLLVRVDRGNDSYQDLIHRSALNLHIVLQHNPDGSEALHLVVSGHLVRMAAQPDSQLILRAAYLEAESGERTPLDLARLTAQGG